MIAITQFTSEKHVKIKIYFLWLYLLMMGIYQVTYVL